MGFKGKVAIWDDTGAVDIPGATLSLATSIYSRINNYVATTAERNTLSASMTSAERLGTRMWVDERKGWCTYDGTQWLWEPQRNVLAQVTSGGLDIRDTGTPNIVASTPNVTLPPGQRLLQVVASVQASTITVTTGTSWNARAWLDGSGLSFGFLGQTLLNINQEDVFNRTFLIPRSGNAVFNLHGTNNGGGLGWIRFGSVDITVTDLGPYDGVVTF